MDIEKALKLVGLLANGTDPATGADLEASSVCQQPDVIRALGLAREALERQARRERGLQRARLTLPPNTGAPWTEQDDRVLVTRRREGASIEDLARLHARTTGAIQARLEKLGLLSPAPGQTLPGPAGSRPRLSS